MRIRLWRHSMERKYVNEEQYQHVIKVLKVLRILFLVLGVALLVGGIVLMVLGFNQKATDPVIDSGLGMYIGNIEAPKREAGFNSGMIIGGAFMISVGLMLSFVGGVGLSMIIHRREITGFMVQQSEPIVREGYQAYKDTIQEAVKDTCEAINSTKGERVEDPDKDHKFCKYCGNVLENDAVFCEFCGKKLN